jgi:hypothetical protein
LCARRILVDVTTSEIGERPETKSHKVATVAGNIIYVDVNETPAPKRTVHVRFSAKSPLSTTTASTVKLPITRDKVRKLRNDTV